MKKSDIIKEIRSLHKENRKLIRDVMREEDRATIISMFRKIRENSDRISELNEIIRSYP